MNKTSSYRDALLESLRDDQEAREYLNAALEDSREAFLKALKNVAQARNMTKIAKDSGVQRETLYRSFSDNGNPTLDTLSSVLSSCGFSISIKQKGSPKPTSEIDISASTMTITRATAATEATDLFTSNVDLWSPMLNETSTHSQELELVA